MIETTPDTLARADVRHLIHPQTPLREHIEQGPVRIFVRGEGAELVDIEGRRYIDGLACLWNVNVGHGRRELAEAAAAQMETLAYSTSFAGFSHIPGIQLAEKLAQIAPGDLGAIHFTSGGSDANDSAFKFVRMYWKLVGQPRRTKIISRFGGYHGVTLAATAATGMPPFWELFGPMPPDFTHIPALDTDALEAKIVEEGPETVAAFIAEPVQGAGGVVVPPADYFPKVRQICDRYGVLFIADEVICGFGRTGRLFGVQHWDIVPDLMVVAKGITSGYIPLAAVIISERRYQEIVANIGARTLLHGFTYNAHPTACAVALRNIRIIEEEGLVERSAVMGKILLDELGTFRGHEFVGDVRGLGLMAAIQLFQDPATRKPFPPELGAARKVQRAALDRGLLCRALGGDVLAMAPPLVISEAQVRRAVEIVKESMDLVTPELRAVVQHA
ncbi:MAG: aspartate aminotransferase family protein [Armatimonadetes bacterium]|nr:aspartate aminotransferase family protein [Armatimonadota bacterium]